MKKPVDTVWNKNTSLWSKQGKIPFHQTNSAISGASSSNICILCLKSVLMILTTLHGVHPSLLMTRLQKKNTWVPGKPGADSVCFLVHSLSLQSVSEVHRHQGYSADCLIMQVHRSDVVNQFCNRWWLQGQPTCQEAACCTHSSLLPLLTVAFIRRQGEWVQQCMQLGAPFLGRGRSNVNVSCLASMKWGCASRKGKRSGCRPREDWAGELSMELGQASLWGLQSRPGQGEVYRMACKGVFVWVWEGATEKDREV